MYRAFSVQIIGTYAQTELGHGTYLQGLETTATFDKNTQEFIITTPTLTSTKWWPGGLAKTANHCIVMARLIIDGKDYSIHPFILQIRSLEDHTTLPGIELGDIGAKLGFHSVDNGYMRLKNVRIPRKQMLMRYASVDENGNYTKPPHAKLSYGTMIYVRAMMISDAADVLSVATTISIRYSVIRHQGYLPESNQAEKKEQKILDFKLQQYRLFPLLATAFALHFTGREMNKFYEALKEKLHENDFSTLPEVHATSAGLKAVSTWIVSDAIEECRKCCGGHGYLKSSGLVHLFADYVPSCTFEGDNYVLIQQTARYLFKTAKKVRKGKMAVGNVFYLNEENAPAKLSAENDWRNPQVQLAAFEFRARKLIYDGVDELDALILSGISFSEAWNERQPSFVPMVKAHCHYVMLKYFVNEVNNTSDLLLRTPLKSLCDLFALTFIENNLQPYLEDGYLNSVHTKLLRKQILIILSEIRVNAVALVDSFNHTDFKLNSALGKYDGNVYEALYESAKNSSRNKTDVAPAYEKFIAPLIKANL